MNKKRLLTLPVVCVVVAMIGASVMAAGSAQKNFTVTNEAGEDITANYSGLDVALSDDDKASLVESFKNIDGIQDQINEVNDKAKVEDAELVAVIDIEENVKTDGKKTVTFTGIGSNSGDVFAIYHLGGTGESVVTSDPSITVDGFSPFLVFRIAVTSSAQTGEYATPYIVVLAGALVACGAVCVVRAKKATR